MEGVAAHAGQPRVAHLGHLVGGLHGAETDIHPRTQHPVHHAHARDRAQVLVVVGVEDERAQGRLRVSLRRRHPFDDRLQDLRGSRAFLGAGEQHLGGIHPQEVREFVAAALRFRAGKIDLVDDGDDLQVRVQRQEQVRDGLRLDALAGVDHQDGAFARRQGAGHLVGEVDVSGGVDQVELIALAVARRMVHAHGVQFDGDAPLAFQLVGVEHLGAHLAGVERTGEFKEAIGQRRLAVVDVRDDAEVANAVELHGCLLR